MLPFKFFEPSTFPEACATLAEHEGAKPVAGGTSLVILMKQGFASPSALVNLAKISDGRDIGLANGVVQAGALATMSDVASAPLVRDNLRVLASACHAVANTRIRNVATLGGNLAHADYQEDPPTALLALDTEVELASVRGVRTVALDQFLCGVYSTLLAPDEVIVSVRVPVPDPAMSWQYTKFKTRSSEDRPTAAIAVGLRLAGESCAELRLAVGAATERPVRIRKAERASAGVDVGAELFEDIAEAAAAAIHPVEDMNGDAGYKRRVVRALVRRAVASCAAAQSQSPA